MSKYTITIEGDFEKGDCWECPISYDTTDIYGDYTMRCPVVDCDDCPLEEVKQGEWNKSYQSGMRVSNGFVSSCCDMWNERKSSHCPNCGTPMKGGAE